ncbi:hypothetical protein ILUMI_25633 [Ignelater luminosus]|uniref:CBM39 domain-containing protein n=1 Tax=Ignelater luminosus TaxID=2038154 RepID=A0A8K0C4L2_IGNLU|nr:hypothetical protein ILUMI_25633 [Ignelater luminosus]
MLAYKVVLIVFLVVPLNGQRRRNTAGTYKVPQPRIEAYTPVGFSVSIEDSPGIRLFAFHGSVNKELEDLEAGEFSKDVLHTENGRWTFEDRRTRLHVGDIIYYWLFVIRDDLGYRLDNGWFEVKELVDSPFELSPRPPKRPTPPPRPSSQPDQNNQPDTSCNTIPQQTTTTTEAPDKEREAFLRLCELTVLNATQALLSLQSQVNSLTITNQKLTALLEKYPDGRKLTISGRLQKDDDALTITRFVLREKLDLNPDVVSATRNSDGSITFELSNLTDKIEVLEAAKEKLKNSRVIIS